MWCKSASYRWKGEYIVSPSELLHDWWLAWTAPQRVLLYYHGTVQQIRSADTGNGLDHWGYLRKGGGWIWRQRGREDQEVSANGTAETRSATVQPCACVCSRRVVQSFHQQQHIKQALSLCFTSSTRTKGNDLKSQLFSCDRDDIFFSSL